MQNIYTIFIKHSAYFKNKQFIYLQIKNSVSMLQTHSMWLYYNLLVGRDFRYHARLFIYHVIVKNGIVILMP